MKKNRLFAGALFIALCCLGFTGCKSDDDTETVITFEDVNLGTTGFWNGNDLTGSPSSYVLWGQTVTEYAGSFKSGILTCNNVYNATYGSWSGIACSSHTNMDSIGYRNQYSVYASSGASGSSNFALLCPFDSSTCSFSKAVDIQSLMINNSTYAYWALKDGKDGYGATTKFKTGDYFYITITGFDENGLKTDSVNYYLADFRDGKSYICQNWTNVSLTTLGKIKSMSFKMKSTDTGDNGMNTPSYACIDNIVYK